MAAPETELANARKATTTQNDSLRANTSLKEKIIVEGGAQWIDDAALAAGLGSDLASARQAVVAWALAVDAVNAALDANDGEHRKALYAFEG
jgi:hypothetical protein